MSDEETEVPTPGSGLFQHQKKPDWGLAILAWDRADQRAYQFEDGKLRVFKEGYYQFLQEVDRPADETKTVVAQLERQLGVSVERSELQRSSDSTKIKNPLTFDEQIQIFVAQYPEGFKDKAWIADKRGGEGVRRLKRHREPAIAIAQEKLNKERLVGASTDEELTSIVTDMIEVLGKTDLVSAAQRAPMEKLRDERVPELGRALADVIYGEDTSLDLRVGRYFGALRGAVKAVPSWNLATAVPSLVAPSLHICVRPNAFREQAAWLAPRLPYVKTPNGPLYQRFLSMAESAAAHLREAGHEPRDLLDVYDFIWTTLRPSARKFLPKRKIN